MFLPNGHKVALNGTFVRLKVGKSSVRLKHSRVSGTTLQMRTIKLFRPVGQLEFDLIAASGFKSFPPRLPEQPIFYPVLTEEYATQIARDWNTKDERSGYTGYVLEFDVDSEYLTRFDIQKAGSSKHLEYWIPAQELQEFNDQICGAIRVVSKLHPKPCYLD